MKPSSRTPEGESNRCPICGKAMRLEPSDPPGDAPCPFCGSLLWFDSPGKPDFREGSRTQIELRFRGGCRDGAILSGKPDALWSRHGRRYCRLARRGNVGTQYREVLPEEYGLIAEVLKSYGSINNLSQEDLQEIAQKLEHVRSHVYQVTHREETSDKIVMELDFVHEGSGT